MMFKDRRKSFVRIPGPESSGPIRTDYFRMGRTPEEPCRRGVADRFRYADIWLL